MELNAEIEELYSCSKWSKRFSADEVIENHCSIVIKKSTINRDTLKHEVHPYVLDNPTEENHYEYYPSIIKSEKLMIFVHGGYWKSGSLSESVYLADLFVKRNCNFAAIGYDLCPTVTLDVIVRQFRRALKSIINRYQDIEEIFLCGHSVGAHLSLLNAVYDQFDADDDELCLSRNENEKLKGMILISGIYDVRPVCQTSVNDEVKLSLADAWRLSPIRCIDRIAQFESHLKVLVVVAEHDSPPFIEQSIHLRDLLAGLLRTEYIFVKDKDHFDIINKLGDDGYALTGSILDFAEL